MPAKAPSLALRRWFGAPVFELAERRWEGDCGRGEREGGGGGKFIAVSCGQMDARLITVTGGNFAARYLDSGIIRSPWGWMEFEGVFPHASCINLVCQRLYRIASC
jgi:hypothetical protein